MIDEGDTLSLAGRVAALEGLVTSLLGQLTRVTQPRGRVFLVNRTAGAGDAPDTGRELTVAGGEVVEFTDGRTVDIIDPADAEDFDDPVWVHEVEDRVDGVLKMSYALLGGDGRAIKDIRWNSTTFQIQVSYVANPAEEDWVDKIAFSPACDE